MRSDWEEFISYRLPLWPPQAFKKKKIPRLVGRSIQQAVATGHMWLLNVNEVQLIKVNIRIYPECITLTLIIIFQEQQFLIPKYLLYLSYLPLKPTSEASITS